MEQKSWSCRVPENNSVRSLIFIYVIFLRKINLGNRYIQYSQSLNWAWSAHANSRFLFSSSCKLLIVCSVSFRFTSWNETQQLKISLLNILPVKFFFKLVVYPPVSLLKQKFYNLLIYKSLTNILTIFGLIFNTLQCQYRFYYT